ncbi:Fur family transcriptional regulator [Flagellimonas baculiformis]|uniref:Fur family transcriptional regulator n=1 Tax=Flagellimonas baculiformis TaxID=3067310 RepID=UPI00296F184C|nr:transcriptional repressor [Muricauda sp. D6]
MKRRKTPAKEAVLNLLSQRQKAMSHDAIEQEIEVDANRATIYRVLNQFCEDGIVHKVVAEDGKQYFAVCMDCKGKKIPSHHFHFRCTTCDTIECLGESVHFSIPEGYRVKDVNCLLSGTCPDCA